MSLLPESFEAPLSSRRFRSLRFDRVVIGDEDDASDDADDEGELAACHPKASVTEKARLKRAAQEKRMSFALAAKKFYDGPPANKDHDWVDAGDEDAVQDDDEEEEDVELEVLSETDEEQTETIHQLADVLSLLEIE